jgi:hypothetical protein
VSPLVEVITSADPETRDRPLDAVCAGLPLEALLAECQALDRFRRSSDNLYQRVRALFFLYAIHRYHIPPHDPAGTASRIPFAGYSNLLKRRFEEAIDLLLAAQAANGPGAAISSALAAAYRGIGFRLWPDRSGAACAQSAATSGCSAPAIPPTTRSACALNCCARLPGSTQCCTNPRPSVWI